MFDAKTIQMLLEGIAESLYMTIVPTVIGYLVGMPLGVLLTVTDRDGIRPNAAVYKVIDFISNIFRSLPFLILVILLKGSRPRRDRGCAEHGSEYMDDRDEGAAYRGAHFSDRKRNDRDGDDPRLFCNGRSSRSRRSRRDRGALRI